MVSYFPILPAIAVLAIVIGAMSRYRPHSYPIRSQATRENAQAKAEIGAAANVADGTYKGSAQGFNGPVTVAVTVKRKKLPQ